MVFDLQCHELEVVKAFFARGIALAAAESASESTALAKLEHPDSEAVEGVVFNPNGAHEFEQILFRSVIGELNSLCEFALQNTWIQLSGKQLSLPKGKLVFSATRDKIEDALNSEKELGDKRIDVNEFPSWLKIKEIKELSEGFKHRQRLQPFSSVSDSQRKERGDRFVDPENENWLAPYKLSTTDVIGYIDSVEKLFFWLGPKSSSWM